MAWENAHILTVADGAIILTLTLFTIYFIYHLKFYASILWASILTISSYVLLLVNNLAFSAGIIKRLSPSWMLAKAFSHGFDATAFLLIVWAAYKIMSPALPQRISQRSHIIAKVLWGFLILPTVASTAIFFLYAGTVTASANDYARRSRTSTLATGTIRMLTSRADATSHAEKTLYATLVLRASQFLAVAFLLTAYAHTQPARTPRPTALTKGERFSLSALTLPALLSGTLASLASAAADVYITFNFANSNRLEMFNYVVYCVVAMSKVVVLGAMVVVIRSWVVANDAVVDEERAEKIASRAGTAVSGVSGLNLVESR